MANCDPKLKIVGLNHKTSTVEDRELLQIGRKEIPKYLKLIHSYENVEGVLIAATCNRLEFYLVLNNGTDPYEVIRRFYSDHRYIDIAEKKDIFYVEEVPKVSRHLFRVISGLDSLVLGEYQIQGQIKEAYSLACQAKTVEKLLHKLFHAAFRAGKKVRNETSIGQGKQSVSGVAAQIMVDNLKTSDLIAIVGVNENSKILAGDLIEKGYNRLIFVNRTTYKAEMMAEQYGGRIAGLDSLEKVLFESKAVFSSTGAPGHIISSEMLKRLVIQERCPELLIDMAIPRDMDTAGLPEEIQVFNIDDLHDYLNQEQEEKMKDMPKAERIIESEVQIYQAWTDTQNVNILEDYGEKFEIIRQQLLEEYRKQFSEQAFDKANKLTKSLVHRMQSVFIRILAKNEKK